MLGQRLEKVAQRTKRPRADYLRSAVEAFIDRWEREADLLEMASDIDGDELAAVLGLAKPNAAELAAIWNSVE